MCLSVTKEIVRNLLKNVLHQGGSAYRSQVFPIGILYKM